MGGGTFLSWCKELPGFCWGGGATADVERDEEDTVEGGGTGDSPAHREIMKGNCQDSRELLLHMPYKSLHQLCVLQGTLCFLISVKP